MPDKKLEQFTVVLDCHWCGHNGVSLWEDVNGNRQLVSIDGFYERVARKEPFPTETICNSCGKVQPL